MKKKKVLVVGLGKSGREAARYLQREGAHVTATDAKPETELEGIMELLGLGVLVEAGGHRVESFVGSDLIILSPGVPPDIPPLLEARGKGVPIMAEIELASRGIREPIIGVTGTNGKTTTTALIGEILTRAGFPVFVGGNIGRPLIEYSGGARCVVAELSSFQLEGIFTFRPFIAVMLNISADHLDRYPNVDAYRRAKERIFMNQKRSDYAILNLDDPLVRDMKGRTKARIYWFSLSHRPRRGMFLDGAAMRFRDGVGGEEVFPLDKIRRVSSEGGLKLMTDNLMAAVLAAYLSGAGRTAIQQALESFRGLPHRCESVAEVNGIQFYDDSKGTNVGAVLRSLESLDAPIILIAGGRDKGGDYSPLKPLVKEKVKSLILIGEAREKIAEAFKDLTEITMADSLQEAVETAWQKGKKGDRVLLSPACSSFDMFKNYEERGQVFQQAVKKLRARASADDMPAARGRNLHG